MAQPAVPVSVFIITYNEIARIREVINSVTSLDEIIVVDSGSDDGTIEAAKELGATVIHQDWLGFSKQKEFALSQCNNQWCFNIDGDEIVPEEVLSEIQHIVNNDLADTIRVRFEDIFMGAPMHPSSHKRSIVRVYKKEFVKFHTDKHVHENVAHWGRNIRIKGCLTHYGYADVATLMSKQNSYSTLAALEKFERNKKASALKLMLVFPAIFLKCLISRKMILSGYRGVIHSAIEAMYSFLKEAKLMEYHIHAKQNKK